MQIDYIAKRSLKSGHTVDSPYTINVELSVLDRRFVAIGDQQVALNGNTVTTVYRRDNLYNLRTIMIENAGTPDNDDMVEFLDSVVSGETFQLDVSGSLENYILASLTNPYRKSRVGRLDIFTYQFRVRAL